MTDKSISAFLQDYPELTKTALVCAVDRSQSKKEFLVVTGSPINFKPRWVHLPKEAIKSISVLGTEPEQGSGAVHYTAAIEINEGFSDLVSLITEVNQALASDDAPVGSIKAYAGDIDAQWEREHGWMICDGRRIIKKTDTYQEYQRLFEAIGVVWGGDAQRFFNIPDLQGRFLRGVAGNSKRDPECNHRPECNPGGHRDNQVGSVQEDAVQFHLHSRGNHIHTVLDVHHGNTQFAETGDGVNALITPAQHERKTTEATNVVTDPTNSPYPHEPVRTSDETRVKNAYVFWIIRYA